MYSIYRYPVDVSCSSHYARDNIKSYIFFVRLVAWELYLYLLDGWFLLVFFKCFVPTWRKKIIIIIIINNNNNNIQDGVLCDNS